MKAKFKNSKITNLLLLAAMSLPLVALFFGSCQKETIVEVPVTVTKDTCNKPDEKLDLIAFLNPTQGALYVDPLYLEQALTQLNAQPLQNGIWVMNGVNPFGEPRPIKFKVVEVNIPEVYNLSATVVANSPDLIHQFTEKGTTYKVFKNAKCGAGGPGFTSGCYSNADGSSYHNVWYSYPFKSCERGDGFCIEALTVAGRKVTFLNANCKGSIKSEETYPAFQCQ